MKKIFNTKTSIRLTIFTILFLNIYFLGSCRKTNNDDNNQPPDETIEESGLDIVWEQVFYSDSSYCTFNNPVLAGNNIVFCTQYPNNSKELGAKVFDCITGVPHIAWQGDPIKITEREALYFDVVCGNQDNIIVLTDGAELYAMDINTGSIAWTHNYLPDNGLSVCTNFSNDIIQTYGAWDYDDSNWSTIGKFNSESGELTDLYTIHTEDGYEVSIAAPNIRVTAEQDTVAYFITAGWNYDLSDGKVDVYAYNISTDALIWKYEDIAQNVYASSKFPPVILDNKMIICTAASLHCLDLDNGTIIWEQIFPLATESFNHHRLLYAEGKLFVRSSADNIMAFDINDGTIIWKNDESGTYQDANMAFYNGNLYYNATYTPNNGFNYYSGLFCLDAATGLELWCEKGLVYGIFINQSNGYLYGTTGNTAICIDLNNTPVE